MIFTDLIFHQWKSFIRGRNRAQAVAGQLIKGFFLFYIFVITILIAVALEEVISEYFPYDDVTTIFCGFIFYYFVSDLFLRYFFQALPSVQIKPYLILNVRKTELIRYFDIKSLFTVFNILPFILFLPFVRSVVAEKYDVVAVFFFVAGIFCLSMGNHFLAVYIKRKAFNKNRIVSLFLLIIAGAILADWFQFFSFRNLSAHFFLMLLQHPWSVSLCLLWMLFHFFNNYFFQKREFYLSESSKTSLNFSGLGWLYHGNLVTEVAILEFKMIVRNKRPRSLFTVSWLFLFYGFIIFKEKVFNNGQGFPLLGAFLIVGTFAMNYGQFFFAWQSLHFDGLITGNINSRLLVKGKFRLMKAICTVNFLLSLLYMLIDVRAGYILFAGYLFCIGVVPLLLVLVACYNFKYLDISESSSFNFQGTGATQWLTTAIVFIALGVIYFPFSMALSPIAGIWAVSVVGLINLLSQDWWISVLCKQFEKNKYKMLEGFRER